MSVHSCNNAQIIATTDRMSHLIITIILYHIMNNFIQTVRKQ